MPLNVQTNMNRTLHHGHYSYTNTTEAYMRRGLCLEHTNIKGPHVDKAFNII